jgi:hypothetical protein
MAFPFGLQSDLLMLTRLSGTPGVYLDHAARGFRVPPRLLRALDCRRECGNVMDAGRLPGKKKRSSAGIPRVASLRTSEVRINTLHPCTLARYRRTMHCAIKYVRVIVVPTFVLPAEAAHRSRTAGGGCVPTPPPLACAGRAAWISSGTAAVLVLACPVCHIATKLATHPVATNVTCVPNRL